MKLIDLLVRELPKRGGWPDGASNAWQSTYDGEVYFCKENGHHSEGNNGGTKWYFEIAFDRGIKHAVTREQYEEALAASEGWIEWTGGECPVFSYQFVDVKFRDGETEHNNESGSYSWRHGALGNPGFDIIAYRLHKPDINSRANDDRLEQDLNECIGQGVDMPVWNGDGLPPVGCECEFYNGNRFYARDSSPEDGQKVKVVHHEVSGAGIPCAVFVWIGDDKSVKSEAAQEGLFRPISSEADNRRDAALDAIYGAITSAERAYNRSDEADKVYEAIAAGKIPGVKLED